MEQSDNQQNKFLQLQEENISLSLELEALKKKFQDNEKELEHLRKENIEQKNTVDNLIKEMQETIFAGNGEPGKSDDTYERSTDNVETMQPTTSKTGISKEDQELERLLEATLEERERLEEKLEATKAELTELKNINEEIQLSLMEATSSGISTTEEKQELYEKKIVQDTKVDSYILDELEAAFEDERTEFKKEIENLQGELLETKAKMEEIKQLRSQQETSIPQSEDEKVNEIRTLRKKTETLQNTIKTLASKTSFASDVSQAFDHDFKEQIKDLKAEIEHLEKIISEKDEFIMELQSSPAYNISKEKLSEEDTIMDEKILTIEKNLNDVKSENQELTKNNNELLSKNNSYENKISVLEENQSSLTAQLETKLVENQKFELQIKELQEIIEQTKLKNEIEDNNKFADIKEQNSKIIDNFNEEKNQFEITIDRLNDEILKLNNENAAEKKETSHKIKDFETEIENLTAQLEQKKLRLAEQEKLSNLEVEEKSSFFQNRITELEKMSERNEQIIQELKGELKERNTDYNNIQNELKTSEISFNERLEKIEIETLEEKNTLIKNLAEKEHLISSKDEFIQSIEQQFHNAENQVETLKNIISEKEQKLTKLLSDSEVLDDEAKQKIQNIQTEMQTQLDDFKETLNDKNITIEQLKVEIGTQQSSLEVKDNEISELQKALDDERDTFQKMEETLADDKKTIEDFSSEHDDLKQQLTEKNNLIQELENRIAEKMNEIDIIEKRLVNAQQEAEQNIANILKTENITKAEIEKEFEQAKEEISSLKTKLTEQEKISGEMSLKIEQISTNLDEKVTENQDLQVHNNQLKRTLEQLNERLDEAQDNEEALISMKEIIEEEQQKSASIQTQLNEKIAELQHKNEDLKQNSTAKYERLLGRLKDMTSQLETLNEEKKKISAKNVELEVNLEAAKEELAEKETILTNNEKLAKQQANLASQGSSDDRLSNLLTELEEKNKNIAYIKSRARDMKTFYEKKIRELKIESTPIVELTGGGSINLNDLKYENEKLRQKIFSMKNELENKALNILELKNSLSSANKDTEKTGAFKQDGVSELPQGIVVQELEDKIAYLTELSKKQEKNLKDNSEKIQRLQWQQNARNKNISSIIAKVNRLKTELEGMTKRKTKELISKKFTMLNDQLKKL